VLADANVGSAWKAYFTRLEREILGHCVRLFGAHILAEYPDFEARFGRLDALRTTPRSPKGPGPDVFIDSLLLMHTPVLGAPSIERGPHVKIAQHFLLGYLTLRIPGDASPGGDYMLYAPRPGASPVFDQRQATAEEHLETRRVIPRRHNSIFLFLNSARSIQSVSIRPVTPYPLIAHHFALRLGEPLFELRLAPGVRPLVPQTRPSVARTLRVLRENAGRWAGSRRREA
jgi:hypothetical protein